MWRTRRTRVAQAAGVVQAGVVRTGDGVGGNIATFNFLTLTPVLPRETEVG